ncbi:MAG: hypothetical protein DDT40_00636 [candidate division WS2 bacterium]|uniref:Probable membrane transporter protein n=1 Tax=Psychracetigena formicireducens TaxID=2986056 RepID=A0A9E2BF06_PSYF1|nr:hypothetical protein [Candidatus Psychracetigena formicireducens]MBT9144406.1 hypothetical protein [Candidatus Psychracetigena formicireducens]MBT9150464.1 hypothetical protein [Candidatus Psychracetigena formicireducens]
MNPLFILLGLVAGTLGGLIGVGGGVIIVPSLIYFFGFSQHQAQGTSLAVFVLPVGLLAAYTYFRQGNLDIKAAALICIGVFLGMLFGAKIANLLPSEVLKKVFGFFFLLVSLRMLFFK